MRLEPVNEAGGRALPRDVGAAQFQASFSPAAALAQLERSLEPSVSNL
jgi:hypothetical protein